MNAAVKLEAGKQYRLITNYGSRMKKGEILTLTDDDGTTVPQFRNKRGELTYVAKSAIEEIKQ